MTVGLILVGLAFAAIPAPPVNQNMGIYDTLLINYNETMCRVCHASGVPDTHHNLVANHAINRYTSQPFQCTDCHPVLPDGTGITMVRNCIQCHNNTFNGMNIRRQHHETQAATIGNCQACHGSLVDNINDGHYIATSPLSNLTPNATFKVINLTSGKKWGGCESCHGQDLTATPFIASNNKTHHSLGNLSGFINQNNSKCELCHDNHDGANGPSSIRICERCHSINAIHNIQWDIANTSSQSGFGHLGPNDCQGCHAWYVAGSLAPGSDLIVPTIDHLSTNQALLGETTNLTIHGENFVTTVNGITRSSIVALTKGVIKNGTTISNITINPTRINDHEIFVTIPPLNKGLYAIYLIKDGNEESNKRPFVVGPEVIVNSAILKSTLISKTVTINGSGFGTYDPAYNNWTYVTINNVTTFRSVQVTNWSETSINVTSPDARIGDTATVNSIYGANSTQVTGG
ncbi:MAG: IPT/TIG domain-containing protein [Candidatus Methanoperedens sp.]|nr:IPT/TIG domain-containing protein [Candidatus Methanoperedens sp.]MCZ7369737.1 IPT/TIG domain-containing protein [Candidatus Methanoperedens sp.]